MRGCKSQTEIFRLGALGRVTIEHLEYKRLSGDRQEWCPGGGAGKPKTPSVSKGKTL